MIVGLIVLSLTVGVAAQDKLDELGKQLRFYRWLENYDTVTPEALSSYPLAPLKRLSFSNANYPYLTLGGDYRFRYEHNTNQFFGLRGDFSTDSRLHRFMLHGDLQFNSGRVFVQIADFEEAGQHGGPGPLDESQTDIQQAFVDLKPSFGRMRLIIEVNKMASGTFSYVD